MPHYADGTEIKIGDQAHGKTHGSPEPVTGTIVGITPSAPTCNVRLARLEIQVSSPCGIQSAGLLYKEHNQTDAMFLSTKVDSANAADLQRLDLLLAPAVSSSTS